MTNETTASQPKSIGDDANPWTDGAPPHPWDQEWFIAITTYGDRVCLKPLPEEFSYDYKTADETYIKRDKIKCWMQFPDSEYVSYLDSRAPAAQASATIQFLHNVCADVLLALRNCDRQPLADLLESALRDLPVSATIQAAPKTSFDDYWWEARHRARTQKEHARQAWEFALKSAATIQEPVMVAEPVGVDTVIGWITTGDLDGDEVGEWDIEFDRKKIDSMPEFCQPEATYDVYLRVSPAAPMVADPAGVALRQFKECSGDDEPNALERLRFFCSLAMKGQDWLDSEKFFDDVAATVKAVPSEALDDAQRERIRDGLSIALGQAMDCTRTWSAWGLGTMSEDDFQLLAMYGDRLDELVDAVAANLAAPLADKIGGGE